MARYAPLTLDTAAGLSAPRSAVSPPSAKSAAPGRGILQHLFDALVRARTRQAEREIARHLARVRWTDQTEREVERRLVGDRTSLSGN